ncbi:WLM-domain-containing protein [Thozetella sp. PMI_491]|nr:WLM-domain-containing protein [Thozetella sp. PMI_491]
MASPQSNPSPSPGPGRSSSPHDPATELPEPTISLTVKFTPESFASEWSFPADATLDELLVKAADTWPDFDWERSKLLPEKRRLAPGAAAAPPTPVPALLKAQADDSFPLARLDGAALKIMAPKRSDLDSLHEAAEAAARRAAVLSRRRARGSHPTQRRSQQRTQDDARYTFHTVRPLAHLPRPERSLAFLERLKADPGIRSAMRKHQFSVGLLTEMDPLEYTSSTHEGTTRILGLNRNQGEVIELRLRTDAGDGYRDYGVIRKTLCHELAHNVHGPHDANFWALCRQIEREVLAGDWKSGGHAVGDEEFAPSRGDEEEDVMDHGGWSGGEFVLGSGSGESTAGLSRREILARAAEQRRRDLNKADESYKRGPDQDPGEGGEA